jgi:hypothetical protein
LQVEQKKHMKKITATIAVNKPAVDIPLIMAEKFSFIPLLIELTSWLETSSTITAKSPQDH